MEAHRQVLELNGHYLVSTVRELNDAWKRSTSFDQKTPRSLHDLGLLLMSRPLPSLEESLGFLV